MSHVASSRPPHPLPAADEAASEATRGFPLGAVDAERTFGPTLAELDAFARATFAAPGGAATPVAFGPLGSVLDYVVDVKVSGPASTRVALYTVHKRQS